MSFLEGSLYLGILVGTLLSSYVYQLTSAAILFLVAAVISFGAVLYTYWRVEESIQHFVLPAITKWV